MAVLISVCQFTIITTIHIHPHCSASSTVSFNLQIHRSNHYHGSFKPLPIYKTQFLHEQLLFPSPLLSLQSPRLLLSAPITAGVGYTLTAIKTMEASLPQFIINNQTSQFTITSIKQPP
ncbi:hypothetical protein M0R45_019782 [Rubus argutus]|uniref:Uncharacterized protein n=1 Tax=Rubus argutus TaxID=59490 RepID=A0AAW1X9L3_RUBAR